MHWQRNLLCHFYECCISCVLDRDLSVLGSVPENTQALILAGNSMRIDILNGNNSASRNLSNIQYVDLARNEFRLHQVEPLHQLFTQLQSLRALDLSNNYLESLHPSLFDGLKSLEYLSLSGNSIVYIERNTFQALTNLKTLKLNNNLLRSINAEWFSNISLSLRDLDLSGNKIPSIESNDLTHVRHIERLNLSKNNISQFVTRCFYNSSVRELDLSHNQIPEVPLSPINSLYQLTILNLNNNPIVFIHGTDQIRRLLHLKQISMSNMPKLRVIAANAFFNLPSLIKLEVFGNPEMKFFSPQSCFQCPNLTVLYLHNNALEGLGEDILVNNPNIREISLYNNNLHCGCFAAWLREKNGSVNIIDGDKMVCQSPHAVKSATLYQLTEQQLSNDCMPQVIRISEPQIDVGWGLKVSLECQSIGAMSFSWTCPTSDIDEDVGEDYVIKHENKLPTFSYIDSLKAKSHDLDGVYSCVAISKQGLQNSQSIYLRVIHPDIQLKTTAISKSFIVLNWQSTSGSKVISYAADDGVIQEIQLDEEVTQYTLEDLKPNSAYSICLLYHDRADKSCLTVHMLPLKRLDVNQHEGTNSKADDSSHANGIVILITVTVIAGFIIFAIALVAYKKCQRYKQAKIVYSRHLNESCSSVESSMSVKIDRCYNPTTAPLCDNEMC